MTHGMNGLLQRVRHYVYVTTCTALLLCSGYLYYLVSDVCGQQACSQGYVYCGDLFWPPFSSCLGLPTQQLERCATEQKRAPLIDMEPFTVYGL